MKTAIASEGKNETSEISPRGARAPYYLIFENKKLTKTIKNPFAVGGGGAGWSVAHMLTDEKVDLVILAGDLTFAEQSTKNIIGPFLKEKKKVLLLHGNHESLATADFLSEMYAPYARNLHSYSVKHKDLGIFGAGGATGFNISEKEIFKVLEKGNKKVKDSKKKIMITHMHAAKTKSEFSGWPGSASIRKAVEKFKPDLFIHSHIHEAEGIEDKIGKTRILNVGRRGKIIEI